MPGRQSKGNAARSAMIASPDPLVRFGVFELDLRTGELRKSGVRVHLPDQPFQVLKALLERPGDLVSRDELRHQLWSAETFVDFEHGLNAAVRRLRDVLGDAADVPRFVETLPRRGYRFIAPITRHSPTGEPDEPVPETAQEAIPTPDVGPGHRRRRTRNPIWIAGTALLGAVALWAAGHLPWFATRPAPAPTGRLMLAVLPFQNLTGDPEQEYIGDGMTEELIAQLGRMDPPRLGVIARTSAMRFKSTSKGAGQIGAELGVGFLVEASFRTLDNRIRIAVELIDTQSQTQRWAQQYERDATNLLTVQREFAAAITEQITSSLGIARSHEDGADRRHSSVGEAYEHYLRGRYHLLRETSDGLHKALEHFQRAIALDASYARAYSGLADTYTFLGASGLRPMSEAYPLARTAALQALAIDDTLGEAHNALAAVTVDYYWDWSEGRRHYERAIELDPNYERALGFYAFYLSCLGQHQEALAFAERAKRLDPVSPAALMNVAAILYFARRYDEATVELNATLDLAPDFGPARILLGRVYAAKGMPDRAVDELKRAEALLGPRPDVTTPHAYVLARAGRHREARAFADELRRISKPRDPAPFRLAMIHIGLGETDQAFAWLEKALDERDWQMALLNVEPAFDSLRSDPRFAALVGRVGLPR